MYSKAEKKQLLGLARNSILRHLRNERPLKQDRDNYSKILTEKRGTFVTLSIDETLRGCIGHLEPILPLYQDITDNAIGTAFHDPRFNPLNEKEFEQLQIEISVLSEPKNLEYKDSDDLISKLMPGKDGVIIEKNGYSATFLPQVWEQIKNPEDFLSHLCVKAGLSAYEWKKGDLNVKIYEVESFDEKSF